MIRGLDHVQLAMPPGGEHDAQRFYAGVLGLTAVPKPPQLASRGGCWFESGPVRVHLGVDRDFRPARKAHPALVVDRLPELVVALRGAGCPVVDDEPLDGYNRVYTEDPFGNRIELLQPLGGDGGAMAGPDSGYVLRMASDVSFKVLNAFHRSLVKVSGGRFGWRASRMPVVELTTVGRKSGQPRTVMLTSPYQEGSMIVVVASRGGDDRHPDWFLNLQANPSVDVALGREPRRPMRARVATDEERARLWPLVIADHANYAGYQKKTAREIPLVLLEPA